MTATWRIDVGDCRELLAGMDEGSVQTCVTSPPYFGLRDYGTGSWEGGDEDCDHKGAARYGSASTLRADGRSHTGPYDGEKAVKMDAAPFRDECGKCGARRIDRQIGLEPTPDEFVAAMVDVFRRVRRVLRDDGTLWLNLGDSYSRGANSGTTNGPPVRIQNLPIKRGEGIKPKDLIGIPWMVAFALRADGWYLRSDIIWHKPNPMPESVTDRPTRAHEFLFLLSKQSRYFYDADAIREDDSGKPAGNGYDRAARLSGGLADGNVERWEPGGGRNKRDVWTVTTQPFAGAHFATFPPKLIEPCVLAGAAEGDTVLDPFAGAGTTGLVALRHNRSFVGCELNPEYAELARDRIRDDAPLLNTPSEVAA